jgi:hypothetical protein
MPSERRYGLDFLRAAMMFLGVVLHAGVSFVPGESDPSWPYRDPERSTLLGVAVLLIHMFRMPAFFVLAGYFVARSIDGRGLWQVVQDRSTRVLLPMVVGWVVLFPAVKGTFVYAMARAGGQGAGAALDEVVRDFAEPWGHPHPMHLWFLWYLWLFILTYAALRSAGQRLMPADARERWDKLVNGALASERPFLPSPVLFGVTLVTLLPMSMPGIDTPGSFVPQPHIFACYYFFFWVGVRLFRAHESTPDLLAHPGRRLIRAGLGVALYMIATVVWFESMTRTGTGLRAAVIGAQAALSLTIWPLMLGGAAFAERWITRDIPVIRFLSDSAYWVYLLHLPLCVGIAAALRDAPYSALTKCGLTIGITMALCLMTFQAVRAVVPSAPRARGGS